jgi:acetoin utilization protein AcuB
MFIARDLMTSDPVAVRASDKVRDAVQILQALEIRHLPVVNGERELVGILSDRDLRGLSLPVVFDEEWAVTIQTALDAPVSTLMTGDALSVHLEADASEVIELMLEQRIGAVPVVDGDNRLVGIISYVDVLRELPIER